MSCLCGYLTKAEGGRSVVFQPRPRQKDGLHRIDEGRERDKKTKNKQTQVEREFSFQCNECNKKKTKTQIKDKTKRPSWQRMRPGSRPRPRPRPTPRPRPRRRPRPRGRKLIIWTKRKTCISFSIRGYDQTHMMSPCLSYKTRQDIRHGTHGIRHKTQDKTHNKEDETTNQIKQEMRVNKSRTGYELGLGLGLDVRVDKAGQKQDPFKNGDSLDFRVNHRWLG